MAIVPITLSELEVQLLKGLPIQVVDSIPGGEKNQSNFLKDLIERYETDTDDHILMLAYQLFYSIQNEQPSWLDEVDEPQRLEILLLLAAKLLGLFVQLNSTGPELKFLNTKDCLISLTTKVVFEEMNIKSKLELDGLEISEHVVLPQLLVIAQEFLMLNSGNPEIWIGHLHAWWCIRVNFLHQKILDGRSLTLAGCIGTAAAAIQTQFDVYKTDMDLVTLWYCEMCDVHLFYYDVISAKNCLVQAGEACGAQFYTTGLLGKRTRFQQKDLAQLVVKANVETLLDKNTDYLEEFKMSGSLVNVKLDDDTRLENITLKEADGESISKLSLTTAQQVVLLSELNYVKKSQAKDELLREGIIAYVNSLLEEPKLWSVLLVSLLHRSIVETDHRRTVERSMMQFENIQSAVSSESTPSFKARYQFYHATSMPLKWEIDIALADVLLSLGQVKNALDIYLRLNMWENVIACYTILELRHKAAEVIQEQIKKFGESPKLLVYLGDATSDLSYYEKAWTLSKGRNFLSQQRLGVYWFKKQEYNKAIPYLKMAVELNPLECPVWIRLGYAALQAENWELCSKAYVHANNLDDESFENWNNLANASLKLGNKDQALRALKQATKCNYEEWKVWENLMVVALQCRDLEWTILSFNRLLDIKGQYADEMVLRLLVDLVCDDTWDTKGDSSKRCKDSLLKLFGRVTSKVTTNPDVWQSYSTFVYRTLDTENKGTQESIDGKWHKLIQYQQKALRCHLQNSNWDKLPHLTEKVIESTLILVSRTRTFINTFPNNSSKQDFKTQAEFLYNQISNMINKKLKEVPDPTVYLEFASKLQTAQSILSGAIDA